MGAKDPLPASISRYKILKRLGEGGMGSLFLARDPEMDRLLAIKLLREDVESDELRERFKREARANARLNHQNIVIVYDVGEDMGRPFIAMEYIEGNTLSGVIRAREDLTLERKMVLMEQLCDGLAYAHRAGIVHRDIKPANLMLDGRGTLKILDFGIARIGHAAATGMTQAGTLMGTLNYMSPEQMTGRPVDHRTDIFAVGAVVYEFLAYQRAFPGDIQDGVLHRIIHEPPPPLEKFVPGIDKAVTQIVSKALEKDRENRYQDLDQMRQDIAKFRARQMLRDETPAAHAVTHDEGTIVVRPLTHTGSRSGPPTPGPVTDPKKAELLRKKQKQIESLLEEARSALDAGDADSVFTKCESVLMLDPDNMVAVELSEKAQTMGERAKQQTLLAEARTAIQKLDLTRASQLVGEALVIDPTSSDALAVRKEIDSARKRKQQEESLAQEIKDAVESARKALAASQYEKAIQLADGALHLDPQNADALEIKRRANVVVEERQRQLEAKARAKAEAEAQAKAAAEAEAARRKKEEDARLAKAKAEAQAAETARLAKVKADAEAAERRQQEETARVAKARADADATRRQQEETARLARQQDEERKRQQEKQQEEEARRAKAAQQEAERKRREEEVARRAAIAAQDATQPMPAARQDARTMPAVETRAESEQTVIAKAPPPPIPYEAPGPGVQKKGGLSPVVMGGAAAAVVVVAAIGYFAFGGKKAPQGGSPDGGGTAVSGPASVTFTVTPWAHLEFTGKTDPSQKAACDAAPSCVVSLQPGVYNVRASNNFYRQPDFEITVQAGKPDTVVRSLEGFNPESEVNKLLAK